MTRPVPLLAPALALLGIAVVDLVMPSPEHSLFAAGVLDETAHLLTGLVVLLALPKPARPFVIGVLVGSVLIDLDHLPALGGWDGLTRNTPRPYSHSFVTPLLLLGCGLLLSEAKRAAAFGLALGTLAHLGRDLATGSGVSILWPFTSDAYHGPYAVYFGSLLLLAAASILLRRSSRAAPGARMRTVETRSARF